MIEAVVDTCHYIRYCPSVTEPSSSVAASCSLEGFAMYHAIECNVVLECKRLRNEGKSCDAPLASDIRYGRKAVCHK